MDDIEQLGVSQRLACGDRSMNMRYNVYATPRTITNRVVVEGAISVEDQTTFSCHILVAITVLPELLQDAFKYVNSAFAIVNVNDSV